MSIFVIIFVVLAIAIVALAVFVSTRPDSFHLERSTLVKAPAETIYPLITDFRRWPAWSPFEKMDTETKRTFGGEEKGVGATYGWEGDKTGIGHMLILDAQPSSHVLIKLDFVKPFEAHNRAEFNLVPEAGGTKVTWIMHGPNTFMSKVMSLVFNMEKTTGPMFEQGLASMKAEAEGRA